MEHKIDANGIRNAILTIFLWHFASLVRAVDVILYEAEGCTGTGLTCANIPEIRCCVTLNVNTLSIEVVNSSDCILTTFYSDLACTAQVGAGVGNTCSVSRPGFYYDSARWSNICRRRSLLGELESKTPPCKGQMMPNGVVFTEHGRKGNWILPTSNAIELLSHLKHLSDAEKGDWFRSQGATYREL